MIIFLLSGNYFPWRNDADDAIAVAGCGKE